MKRFFAVISFFLFIHFQTIYTMDRSKMVTLEQNSIVFYDLENNKSHYYQLPKKLIEKKATIDRRNVTTLRTLLNAGYVYLSSSKVNYVLEKKIGPFACNLAGTEVAISTPKGIFLLRPNGNHLKTLVIKEFNIDLTQIIENLTDYTEIVANPIVDLGFDPTEGTINAKEGDGNVQRYPIPKPVRDRAK